ncbi:MAG: hypothetical protein B7Z55_15010 [Planctomycetales bacterium 12-60-4]|nr:MAG: hypothetical protein B7Z55_15010 [Planctomycetales bacterium 12-60-4]
MDTAIARESGTSTVDTATKPFSHEVEQLFDRLLRIDGKAEIVDGRIIVKSPTGAWPSLVALEIAPSLRSYVRQSKRGRAVGDNATFRVKLPHRDSFCPDAAYYVGPPAKMEPFHGAPIFAVEVRSYGDYGPRAERLLAEKREDYFACGTQVVWDVDLRAPEFIKSYVATDPANPLVFHLGEIAHAEPAVPGWTVVVNELLPEDWELPTSESK